MLKVTDKKRSTGTMDRQVRSMVYQICKLWDEMEDFERLFTLKLQEMKSLNHIKPQFAYKLIRHDSATMEVWHLNSDSEPDRLLCVVNYEAG